MLNSKNISVLFLDIGGVLLTNGWDGDMRKNAAEKFGIDYKEMNDRHNVIYDAYERGVLSLDEYLKRVIFCRDRNFTPEQFKECMFSFSRPLNENIEFFKTVAKSHHLKVVAVNNEGRELNDYRINKFHLYEFIESFISSCYVQCRKPDTKIYKLALDITNVKPHNILYFDDRQMFVEVASDLGINSIYHRDLQSTQQLLKKLGLL
jgi:putative hydrolase of the HAD superfamily